MKTMTKEEFNRKTSGMTKDEKVIIGDEIGRMKVQLDLRQQYPDCEIVGTPIHCKYDLRVQKENGEVLMYVEVKDRWGYKSTDYQTIMLNETKYNGGKEYGDKYWYANVFQDNVIIYFRPNCMPETGITEDTFYISKMTVEGQEKIPQKRLLLNKNDKEAEHPNKIDITLLD